MSPATMMMIAAAVCCLGGVLFTVLALRHRDEVELAFLLGVAAFLCMAFAGSAFTEAVKESRIQHGQPVETTKNIK